MKFTLPDLSTLVISTAVLFTGSALSAQTEILNTDFNDLPIADVDSGDPFDATNPLEGVASSQNRSRVNSGIGRNTDGVNVAARSFNVDSGVRSSSAHDIGQTTTFEFFSRVQTNSNMTGINYALFGGGWGVGDPATGASDGGLDGSNAYANAADRFMVGFEAFDNGDSEDDSDNGATRDYRLVYYGASNDGIALTGSLGDTLTWHPNHEWWYGLSFDLTYQGSNNWLIENLIVEDWGAKNQNGTDYKGVVASLASETVSTTGLVGDTIASNIESVGSAYALVQMNGRTGSGAFSIDDISVVVPEPSSYALWGGLSALGLLLRRRR